MSRIALVISDVESLPELLSWAWRMARGATMPLNVIWWRQQDGEVVSKRLPIVDEPESDEDVPRVVHILRQQIPALADCYRQGDERSSRLPTVWELRGAQVDQALSHLADDQDWSLVMLSEQSIHRGAVAKDSLQRFWQLAPCDVMVLRPGHNSPQPETVTDLVVPLAGGPHAFAALRWAGALHCETSRALHILPSNVPEARETGWLRIERWLRKAQQDIDHWQASVLQHDQPVQCLLEQTEAHQLLIMGAGGGLLSVVLLDRSAIKW